MIARKYFSPEHFLSMVLHFAKWFFLVFLFLVAFAPLAWTVFCSFKTNVEIFSATFSWPAKLRFENYRNAFSLEGLSLSFRNTIAVSVISTFACLAASVMAAYALMHRFRVNNAIYLFLILGMYVPVNAFLVPYFIIALVTFTYNTIWSLILVYTGTGLPLSVLVLKGYIDTIPREISESAIIDGAGFSQIFSRIVLPLSGPGLWSVAIFQFVASWNEFLFAMILTADKWSRTLQVSIRYLSSTFTVDYGSMFATMVVCLVPTVVAYTIFQEQIISGLTSGALKG